MSQWPPPGGSNASSAAPAFCVKGLVYSGAQEFYGQRLSGGRDALSAEIGNSDVRDFWERRFTPSTWYDVVPLMAVNQAASRLAHASVFDLVCENAAWIANRDIHGVYRFLLKLANPELVASKLPRASLQYLSFGRAEGEFVGARHFQVRHHGIPRTLSSWLMACVAGFAPTAMRIAGAANIQTTSRIAGPDGDQAGLSLVELVHDLSWR